VPDHDKITLILKWDVQLGQETVCWFADNLKVREDGGEMKT
jgi:hypothetical protein